MSGDWLDATPPALAPPAAIPAEFAARVALVEECWARLSPAQRTFLTAWREAGFNARAANRTVTGSSYTNTSHTNWSHQPDYSTVMRVWRAMAADKALDRDRLLARQDAIVETLLIPKPVIHQGIMVRDTRPGAPDGAVLEEVEAGAASRANEVLLDRVMPKPSKDVDVNVAVQVNTGPPTLNIQVLPPRDVEKAKDARVAIDAQFTEVPSGDDWLDA